MTEIRDLRGYGRWLDEVQRPLDLDSLLDHRVGERGRFVDVRRRRLLVAAAVFVAAIAVPALVALMLNRAADPAEQPAPQPDINLGFEDLVPPTSRPEFLSGDDLVSGVAVHPAVGGCNEGATGQVARVGRDGTVAWVVDTSWIRQAMAVEAGVVVGLTLGERPSLIALDVGSGSALWQRYVDEIGAVSIAALDGVVVMSFQIRGENPAVAAYDVHNGEELWREAADPGAFLVTPEGTLIVGERTRVRRLDPADGSTVWTADYSTTEEVTVAAQFGAGGHVADPGDALLVRSWPATISRLDPMSGEEMWTWTAADDRVYASVHAIVDGAITFEQGFSHSTGSDRPLDNSTERVAALDLATGALLWERTTAEYRTFDGRHWITEQWWDEESGAAYPGLIIDAVSGAVVREFGADARMEGRVSPGGAGWVVLDEYSDFEDPPPALVLPETLAVFWKLPNTHEAIRFVSRLDDVVFVGAVVSRNDGVVGADPGGTLWALDPMTGAELWQLELRDPFLFAPIPLPDGDLLVVASDPPIFCD